ncbi:hypothetical protein FB45DRAFT_1056452 [Roridomyces roridus]|uniref:Uncharacterized protein n=1 Tax=Roridomyces roridus TaxID=1738132 RepID=A0AAD7BYF5_9AGAR|nr:hypothetical protein FB45DRAFT_1056452 [Roridomyces roridus]
MLQENEPRLPTDIEREVFETVALIFPSMIPTLLLVARRVLIWTEPLLYRVLGDPRGQSYKSLATALLATSRSKPPSFLHKSVRHLFLDMSSEWTDEEALQVLRLCTGLVNLLALPPYSNPRLLPILGVLHLRRLSTSLETLFGNRAEIDLRHPLFSSLTHLDIFDEGIASNSLHVQGLCALPALTHLCLNNDVPWGAVKDLLAGCRSLSVFVNLWAYIRFDRAKAVARSPPVTDVRFVVAVFADYWTDWETGAYGGNDFWKSAEEFIELKRRGELPETCYLLEDA